MPSEGEASLVSQASRDLLHVNNEIGHGMLPFENDVDVTSDELRNLLSFSGLNRVVTILIVSKVLKKKIKHMITLIGQRN